MKIITKIIVAVVAVSALLVITCPSKEKHKRVIRDQLTGLVKSELNTENIDTENPFVKVLSAAGVQLLDIFIDKNLVVKNYGLFSVAKAEILFGGGFHHVRILSVCLWTDRNNG